MKEIIFWEGIFIRCLSKMLCFIPVISIYSILVSSNLSQSFIYLSKDLDYFILCLELVWAVKSREAANDVTWFFHNNYINLCFCVAFFWPFACVKVKEIEVEVSVIK